MSHEIEPMDSEFTDEREKILLGLELAIQDISHRLEAHGGKLRAIELLTAYLSVNPIRDVDRDIHREGIPYEIAGGDLVKGDNFNGAWQKLEALDRDITRLRDMIVHPNDTPDEPYAEWEGRPKTEITINLEKLLDELDNL